jgi:hypothetical protein
MILLTYAKTFFEIAIETTFAKPIFHLRRLPSEICPDADQSELAARFVSLRGSKLYGKGGAQHS